MAVGLAINIVFEPIEPEPYWMERYSYLCRIVIWGAVVWTIYVAFTVTRTTNALLRQPMRVDLFDLRPYQPIGRQSLWLSLMFVGGMMLGLLSSNFAEEELRLEYLINNVFILALIVAIFFVNTRNVHRVLAATRRQRVESIERHLASACYRLEALIAEGQDTHAVATELNALATSRQQLKAVRTWPYNTEMLRTIVVSIVTPIVVAIVSWVTAFLLDTGILVRPSRCDDRVQGRRQLGDGLSPPRPPFGPPIARSSRSPGRSTATVLVPGLPSCAFTPSCWSS